MASSLKRKMTEVAVEIVLTAEIRYRERAIPQYQWRVERKAELEEEERQRKLESERAEKERQKRIEQARIDRLLRDAAAFQQAGEIRKYVNAIRLAQSRKGISSSEECFRLPGCRSYKFRYQPHLKDAFRRSLLASSNLAQSNSDDVGDRSFERTNPSHLESTAPP
jgi:hypothetical protein